MLYDSALYKCTVDIDIALVLNPINAREFLITSKRQVATIKSSAVLLVLYIMQHEAQLMLTNPHNTFRGQLRSPNMLPFDVLGMVSY